MKQNIKRSVFILISSPVVLWNILHPVNFIKELIRAPSYFENNIHSMISADKLAKIDEERWNALGPQKEEFFARLLFNKGTVVVDDFFSMLSNLSPRIYFQSGDGTNLTPSGVEPIAAPLFIFWILGVINLIKNSKFKLIYWVFVIGCLVYIFGQKNMAYLMPISIIYSAMSVYGIENIKGAKIKKFIYLVISLYGVFLLGRVFLLK
jgi:hypothetical protein